MVAIYAILLFLMMIIPHEFGHFAVAKAAGVQVNEFSIGMGPKLWNKQKGETLYSVRLLPIGGFCAMEGENEESDNPRAFNNKSPLSKIAVLIAGALMNINTAWLILVILAFSYGTASTTIDDVKVDSPAATAGILSGDQIVSINGEKANNWEKVVEEIKSSDDKLSIEVLRENQ